MNVFDASALLAFLQGETGADLVERELEAGGSVSAANWSEVAQKILARGRSWELARALLLGYPVAIEPVSARDAERAARLWRTGAGLSLADRCCLALGDRIDATVWTADRHWAQHPRVRQIR